MKDELLRLADLCEKATGPDRTLDGLIFARLNPHKRIIVGNNPGPFPQDPEYGTPLDIIDMAETDGPGLAQYLGAAAYTASLDAAMTLVPEGGPFILTNADLDTLGDYTSWRVSLEESGTLPIPCATPALALCAAALKARAASETPNLSPQGHSHD